MEQQKEKEQDSINPLWAVWNYTKPLTIKDTQYTLKGFSIAALRTNFYIKELGIMLDAGISANISPDHIFITHCHSDHSANLPFYLYSYKEGRKIQIYQCSQDKIIQF